MTVEKCGALPHTPPEAAFEKAPLDSRKAFGAGILVGGCFETEGSERKAFVKKFIFLGFEKKGFRADSGRQSERGAIYGTRDTSLHGSSAPTFARVRVPPELARRASSP